MGRGHIVVIDPALVSPETSSFNRMTLQAPQPLTYHLPALYGMASLHLEDAAPEQIKGLLILGSAASVNDRFAWQDALEAWVRPHLLRGVPTLGICYGQQMLAYMFGGAVSYVFADQTKHLGLRQVQLGATPWSKAGSGLLAVSHNEHVSSVPSCFRVFGSSPEIKADALAHTSLPIWSLQSHPEATPLFFSQRAVPLEHGELDLSFGHGLVDAFLGYTTQQK